MRRMVLLALVPLSLAACSTPAPEAPITGCRPPTAEEPRALAECQHREMTNRVFAPGGCDRDPDGVAVEVMPLCWGRYDTIHNSCRDEGERKAQADAIYRTLIDDIVTAQRQQRTYGRCITAQ